MNYIINGREPEALYNYFEDICSIPHGSGNEAAIADYIENFAKERGLYCYRDKNNNVFVRREAAPEYVGHPAVMLQGHTDMVCEADPDVNIDFLKDPLSLRIVDGRLMATGTTLGADDGVAVAIMLTLLAEKDLKAPTIECLFTTEEETGLTGATVFDYSVTTAKKLINLDAGGEVIIASCAGGMRTRIFDTVKAWTFDGKALTVEISGLAGGHSGVDIHLGLGNANLFMIDLIKAVRKATDAHILEIHGGSKDNAIPSRCVAKIAVGDFTEAENAIRERAKYIMNDLSSADSGMNIKITEEKFSGRSPMPEFTERLIGFTDAIPKNVITYNHDIGMVETSLNYAIIDAENDQFCLHLSSRSSISRSLDDIGEILEDKAVEFDFSSKNDSRYEGWAYAERSELRDAYARVYKKVTGNDINVIGIHAGLECGIIKRAVPEMDIIATGPVSFGEHTTKEALDLDSFAKVYKIVKLMLSEM